MRPLMRTGHAPNRRKPRCRRRRVASGLFAVARCRRAALQGLAATARCHSPSPRSRRNHRTAPCCSSWTGCGWTWLSVSAAFYGPTGRNGQLSWRWSGFPTVTATCKPLASPAAGAFAAGAPSKHWRLLSEGKPVTKPVLMKAIEAAGWATDDILLGTDPCGLRLDGSMSEGHELGARSGRADRTTCLRRLRRSCCGWRGRAAACVSSRIMAGC